MFKRNQIILPIFAAVLLIPAIPLVLLVSMAAFVSKAVFTCMNVCFINSLQK